MNRLRILFALLIITFFSQFVLAQNFAALPGIFFHQDPFAFKTLLLTKGGQVLIGTSKEMYEADAQQIRMACSYPRPTDEKGKPEYFGKNSNIFKDVFESIAGVKMLCEGPDSVIYVVTDNNNLGYIDYQKGGCIKMPPINFQGTKHEKVITSILIDKQGTLFVGTESGIIYVIEKATKKHYTYATDKSNFTVGLDADSNYVVLSGALPIKQFSLEAGVTPLTFANSLFNDDELYVGTNEGMFVCNPKTGKSFNYFRTLKNGKCTVTKIELDNLRRTFWLSTLEHGMAMFRMLSNDLQFYPYPKKNLSEQTTFPVTGFFRKSLNEFFVSIPDSTPAIFNTDTGRYTFISDTSFHQSENKTTDILQNKVGIIYMVKGGSLYVAQSSAFGSSLSTIDSSMIGPFIKDILVGDKNYFSLYPFDGRIESLKEIFLKHDENDLTIFYSSRGMHTDSLIFSWKIGADNQVWTEKEYSEYGDYTNAVPVSGLMPGRHEIRIRAKKIGSSWIQKEAVIFITISRPYWQAWWFWTTILLSLSSIVYLIVKWRTTLVRRQERSKAAREKEILELEAKALRAQMNPHFIFNCLNSIKDLIQKDQKEKSINYLATFSKLIRTIFQNSDKREITLHDELENCRLYTELESLRFGSKLTYNFSVDDNIDLKSVMVPSLIIQPFIENAIWHGLMPKETGGRLDVHVSVSGNKIVCIVDDDGIGRERSLEHKTFVIHDSRGVRLTQTRLELSNSINQQNATAEIIDKKDESGQPAGTRVVLNFSIE